MREKLIATLKILIPFEEIGYTEAQIDTIAESLISTLIESLPEEIGTIKNNRTSLEHGWNAYRSEVIDLLRGS